MLMANFWVLHTNSNKALKQNWEIYSPQSGKWSQGRWGPHLLTQHLLTIQLAISARKKCIPLCHPVIIMQKVKVTWRSYDVLFWIIYSLCIKVKEILTTKKKKMQSTSPNRNVKKRAVFPFKAEMLSIWLAAN